jgi:hypothetical protein
MFAAARRILTGNVDEENNFKQQTDSLKRASGPGFTLPTSRQRFVSGLCAGLRLCPVFFQQANNLGLLLGAHQRRLAIRILGVHIRAPGN